MRPRVLGSLYTLLSGALRELPKVTADGKWGHRLVSLDQIGEAAIAAAGMPSGTFLRVIGDMRERMARRAASGDMFVIALLQVLRKVAAKPTHAVQPTLRAAMLATPAVTVFAYGITRIEFTARPSALHRLLPPASLGVVRDGGVPATERGLVDALRRVQPLLSGIGVEVRDRTYGSKTLLQFDFDLGAIND